ncbi:hypothetical protein BBH99_17300 [Chryseobacterium contaminans]|uniref:Uncharacterized protein n=2 Tax=Chryseobacterium contaminans TaxID=1423959 RepID=A0A1M6XWY9_9FLAO|nr:hypothetical protein BBH99_17300 [Chryseobacterium contaminans]SHL10514.1 hypothetical protein SAMN05444407_102257 [Chryseobacterium contaminans]
MIVLVLFLQIVSLVFFFKIIMESEIDSFGCFWYCIAGLHFLFILRFIYVEINFSYLWYEQIMEFISLGISLLIVIPTTIYYLIKRNRKQKKKQ